MKTEIYLHTIAFRVVHKDQAWGSRDEQLLSINNITVNYNMIINDFTNSVINKLAGAHPVSPYFIRWGELFDAINKFINDVELNYPLPEIKRSGYEPDSDSDSDLELGRRFPRMNI